MSCKLVIPPRRPSISATRVERCRFATLSAISPPPGARVASEGLEPIQRPLLDNDRPALAVEVGPGRLVLLPPLPARPHETKPDFPAPQIRRTTARIALAWLGAGERYLPKLRDAVGSARISARVVRRCCQRANRAASSEGATSAARSALRPAHRSETHAPCASDRAADVDCRPDARARRPIPVMIVSPLGSTGLVEAGGVSRPAAHRI